MTKMHHLTHRTLHREKSMNWVSNCCRSHCILQTWPSVNFICSQTSRDGCVVGVLNRTKKLNGKQKGILEDLTNRIFESHRQAERSLKLLYRAERRVHWEMKPKRAFFSETAKDKILILDHSYWSTSRKYCKWGHVFFILGGEDLASTSGKLVFEIIVSFSTEVHLSSEIFEW